MSGLTLSNSRHHITWNSGMSTMMNVSNRSHTPTNICPASAGDRPNPQRCSAAPPRPFRQSFPAPENDQVLHQGVVPTPTKHRGWSDSRFKTRAADGGTISGDPPTPPPHHTCLRVYVFMCLHVYVYNTCCGLTISVNRNTSYVFGLSKSS